MKKQLPLSFLLLVCSCILFAQTPQVNSVKKPSTKSIGSDTSKKHPISLQVHIGSQGLGGDVRYGVTPQLSIRAGGSSIFPMKFDNAFEFSGFEADNTIRGEQSNIHLLADYVPFKKATGFRLVGGAGYLYKGYGNLNITPTGSYKFGDIPLNSQQMGVVNVAVSWEGIAPYFGMGFFKSFPKRRFNINLDLGTYYLTAPTATIVGTGMLSENGSQSELVSSNMSDYRWLPVLQLNFNFKIK